jgi:hypothetical protein
MYAGVMNACVMIALPCVLAVRAQSPAAGVSWCEAYPMKEVFQGSPVNEPGAFLSAACSDAK